MSERYTGRVAATVIPRTGEERYFLVARRNDNGDWEFPGGKEHVDEDSLYTAEREMDEEFSIEVTAVKSKPDYIWKGGEYDIIPVYAEHMYRDMEKVIDEELLTDHSEYTWIDTENLGTNLENAREKLGEEIKALEAFDLL
ncbi:MAG: NUDIX domain-containing protein [Candidatus Nanohalobium sp.]